MATKKCIRCGKRKAESQFAKRSGNGKLRDACKQCITEMAKIANGWRIKRYN